MLLQYEQIELKLVFKYAKDLFLLNMEIYQNENVHKKWFANANVNFQKKLACSS